MGIMYDLIVIGGGASGMMVAGRSAERGLNVLLLEKNQRLGEKLRITGGGRCNITNAEENTRLLLKRYGTAEPFLHSLFSQFGVADTFTFFESHGLPLVVEENKRAFPYTHKADDVVSVLEKYLLTNGARVKTGTAVTDIKAENNRITSIVCKNETFFAKEFVFATGSLSYPETGSTGDGFSWLEKLGHTVSAPTPTIVPLQVKEKWIKTIAGVTIPNAKITFYSDHKKRFSIQGDFLCTHFGLSGPVILNSAHRVADLLKTSVVTATIDLFPTFDTGLLDAHIIDTLDKNKNKSLKNVLPYLTPGGVHKGILLLLTDSIDVETKVHSLSKTNRQYLINLIKALPVTIKGLMGFERAVIADGGVPLQEINTKRMSSKIIPNLFITGDLLHINRPSGGFSLQLCWSTGWVAGSHAGTDPHSPQEQ